MDLRPLKYLLAYVAPICAYLGIHFGGIWSLGGVYFAFGVIPLLEIFSPKSRANLSTPEEESYRANQLFDYLLYANIFILYGLIAYLVYAIKTRPLSTPEIVGMVLSVGVIIGSNINVAHELGHKHSKLDQFLAKLLLVPALYNHFTIEHNLGHHKHVGTLEDPATSRRGEHIYAFWVRSVIGCYRNAWALTLKQLKHKEVSFFSLHNGVFWGHIAQIAYLAVGYTVGGLVVVVSLIGAGIVGFLLLESVNYIEHYGLMRRRLPNGRYERVETFHSWNSNHEVGRIFLYELTRHADHHYKSTRPYQVLRHWDESPQLPHGYPLSIILSLFPPLWFAQMNPLLKDVTLKHHTQQD